MATRGANAAAAATRSARASAARRKPRAVTVQAADAGVGSALSPAAGDAPPPSAGEGGGQTDAGNPVTERNQQVGPVLKARGERRKAARNMDAAMHGAPTVAPTIVPAEINTPPEPGTWRIADLREGQCRFACTADTVPAEAHRFCGEPVAWRGGKPTSWCGAHLDRVCGAPGRVAGGASVADVAAGRVVRDDPPPARMGWGSVGA